MDIVLFDQKKTKLSIFSHQCYKDRKLDNPCWIYCFQDNTVGRNQTPCAKKDMDDDKLFRLIGKQCGKRYVNFNLAKFES